MSVREMGKTCSYVGENAQDVECTEGVKRVESVLGEQNLMDSHDAEGESSTNPSRIRQNHDQQASQSEDLIREPDSATFPHRSGAPMPSHSSHPQAGTLVVCPTPLGNLADMPPRARAALQLADTICAEDTRVTGRLLSALDIEGKRLERLDENLIASRSASIIARIEHGETIVYCTDAGMPGVSDPGLRLVRAARDAHLPVEVLPGPTAAATAYVASGTLSTAFYFGGFFPRKDGQRRALMESLSNLDAALIFYESPNRLVSCLNALAEHFPLREVAVCRELTKLHEEVVRGPLPQVRDDFAGRTSIRGEIVVVLDAPTNDEAAIGAAKAAESATERAIELAAAGLRPKEIARRLADEFNIPRNEAYSIALATKPA